MSTKFYFGGWDRSAPEAFIGKRSAAGPYCWSCRMTLCPGGEDRVHSSDAGEWPNACPGCGAAPPWKTTGEALHEPGNAAGVELGFAQPRTVVPTSGVTSVATFRWHIPRKQVERRLYTGTTVVDEYGRLYLGDEFLAMIDANCPIVYTDESDGWS